MNTTNPETHQDRRGSLSPVAGRLDLRTLEQPERLNTTEESSEIRPVEFAFSREEEFARMLDEYQVAWKYKPRTFAVEWGEEGNFVDSFTPDFYLPALDLYVELIATDYHESAAKARKVRLLRREHPDVRIQLLSSASLSSVRRWVS